MQGETGVSRETSYITASTSVDGPVAGSRAGKLQKCKSHEPTLLTRPGAPHSPKWAGTTPWMWTSHPLMKAQTP